VPYLIDGYNLLHALGVLSRRTGPGGLEWARARLLALLHAAHGERSGDVTVVFDAPAARARGKSEAVVRGIHVVFAVQHDEADDLIEQLIRRSAAPRQLTVVSDDRRLQQAARRRKCVALSCAAYLEEREKVRRPSGQKPAVADKADGLPADELRHWLDAFADVRDDPAFKELSDLYRFGQEEEG